MSVTRASRGSGGAGCALVMCDLGMAMDWPGAHFEACDGTYLMSAITTLREGQRLAKVIQGADNPPGVQTKFAPLTASDQSFLRPSADVAGDSNMPR